MEGGLVTAQINPWTLYFQSTPIAAKLRGFSRLRANLHIRFLLNGSPFRYGDIMVSYKPLWAATTTYAGANEFPFFSGGVIAADLTASYPGGVPPGVLSSDKQAVLARSQRSHIHLYPQTNSGGDMILPFIYPKDALNLNTFWSAGQLLLQQWMIWGHYILTQLLS